MPSHKISVAGMKDISGFGLGTDDLCLPLQPWHEVGRLLPGKIDKRFQKMARAKRHRKQNSGDIDSVSLSSAAYSVFSALRARVSLLSVVITILMICGILALLSLRDVSTALPFSLVFSAPIHDRGARDASLKPQVPLKIPRIIHQTARSFDGFPSHIASLRSSWARFNPDWEIQEWDDARCRDFVRKEFPEYVAAYQGLPKNVERADFFRYLVVLRYGGAYADIDTECKRPLDESILPTDTLLVGWEGEVTDHDGLVHRHFARYRQVQQWFFAATPNHPALRRVCDHIAASYTHSFSEYTNIDTLDRTGPGAWTDAVLETTVLPGSQRKDSNHARFLPQVATGVHKKKDSTPGLSQETPGIVVLHHFVGTWKDKKGYPRNGLLAKLQRWFYGPPANTNHPVAPDTSSSHTDPASILYPVSIDHQGTMFTMMVNLIGHGDMQSHEDAGAMLTRYGNWQAGMGNTLEPRAPIALVGSLGHGGPGGNSPVLLDIGAGIGFYSMTAAARGHKVIATEMSPASLEAMQASIKHNDFGSLVTVTNVTLGSKSVEACIEPGPNGWAVPLSGWRSEDIARGYGPPSVHERVNEQDCGRFTRRVTMADVVPQDTRVGAVRVSAGAWTAEVLAGGLQFLRDQTPAALLIEVDMAEISKLKGQDFEEVIGKLFEMGYQNMGHAGAVCVQRFETMMSALQKESQSAVQTTLSDMKQPSWCDLEPSDLPAVLQRNRQNGLEKQDALDAPGVELFFLQFNGSFSEM